MDYWVPHQKLKLNSSNHLKAYCASGGEILYNIKVVEGTNTSLTLSLCPSFPPLFFSEQHFSGDLQLLPNATSL